MSDRAPGNRVLSSTPGVRGSGRLRAGGPQKPGVSEDTGFQDIRTPRGYAMKGYWSGKRVTVTGGAGFLGQHVVRRLESFGAEVYVPRKRDYDLTSLDACLTCLLEHPSDVLIHAAAYYGGIGINVNEPGRLYYQNLVMGASLMEAARLTKVGKVVNIGTACSYPGYLEGDLKEDDLWSGPCHASVVNYGLTKKMLAVQGVAYKKQYG